MIASRTVLLWAPRLLLIAFALFLIIFSFDVFDENKSMTAIAIAFFMHNIPSMMLGLLVFAAWRREWIGALACTVLAVAYIAWAWGRFPFLVYIAMTGPLFCIAVLYALNWRHRNRSGHAG